VRWGTKCRQLQTQCLQWNMFCISPSQSKRVPPSTSTGPALHIRGWHSPVPDGPGSPARGCPYRRTLLVVSAHTEDRDGGGLRASGGAMRRAGAATPRPDKRRAMGRIEHKLLVGDGHPNRPKTFTRSPLANPPYHKKLQMFLFTTKGRSQVDWKLRPMIEAGTPSTGVLQVLIGMVCASHRG
jgi:hypothetical protein